LNIYELHSNAGLICPSPYSENIHCLPQNRSSQRSCQCAAATHDSVKTDAIRVYKDGRWWSEVV